MLSLGYNESDIVRAVEENQCNEMMATYLLLQQQYCLVGASWCYEMKAFKDCSES